MKYTELSRDLDNKDYLNLFSNEEIFTAVLQDNYLLERFKKEVKKYQFSDMDREDRILFGDIYDSTIFINAYKDLFGIDEVIYFLMDVGLTKYIAEAVMDNKGHEYESLPKDYEGDDV